MCSDGPSSQVAHEPPLVSQEDNLIKIGSKWFKVSNGTECPSTGPREGGRRSSAPARLKAAARETPTAPEEL